MKPAFATDLSTKLFFVKTSVFLIGILCDKKCLEFEKMQFQGIA
jgi:hypothetical protein